MRKQEPSAKVEQAPKAQATNPEPKWSERQRRKQEPTKEEHPAIFGEVKR